MKCSTCHAVIVSSDVAHSSRLDGTNCRHCECAFACLDLIGQRYVDVEDQIQDIDWDGIYPVVDCDGRITGEIVSADTQLDLCDFGSDGFPVVKPGAGSAAIEWMP